MRNEGVSAAGRPLASRAEWAVAALLVGALTLTRLHSYLLFHTLAEVFGLVVGLTVFSVAWNTRRHLDDPLLLGIGIALAPVSLTLLLHTLSYKGMGVFSDASANLATELWVAARLLLAIGLGIATLPWSAHIRHGGLLGGLIGLAILLWASIFTGVFPDCFVEGRGLTPFKIGAEYATMTLFLVAAVRLARSSHSRDSRIRRLIFAALALQFAASAAFTFYSDVYGALNMLGHMLTIGSGMALYAATAWEGLAKPQAIFYGQLTRSKEHLANLADRATGEIDDFAHVLAHHLQEPVRLQYSYTQKLERLLPKPLPPELAETFEFVKAGALRQRALLRDVQLYLSIGQTAVPSMRCDVATTFQTALARLNNRIVSIQPTLEVGKLPVVLANAPRLTDVFIILLDNALTYRRQDIPLRIAVSAECSGKEAILSVTDNGPGIPAEFQDRAFKVFERGAPETPQVVSTGIGLAMAKKIIQLAGGRIWIETPETGGTRVCFTLPLGSP